MAGKVRLKDVVDALEMQPDEYSAYLDRDSGEVESVSDDLLNQAEELGEDPEPELPDWQKRDWEIAKRIASTDRFVALPTKFEVHEWAIMENFSLSVKTDRIRQDLLSAIHGAGAFRHFKSTARRHGIGEQWFAFRTDALREIAVDWCKEHQIAWE